MRLSPISSIPAPSHYRPTAPMFAELDRVAHRVRPSIASMSDEFLSTPEMVTFDDETREIRAKMNLLMRKLYAPPPRIQKPTYFPIKTEEPAPEPDWAQSRILTPMRRVNREIGRRAIVLLPKEIEKHPRPSNIGKGRLACMSFAGGRAFPRRRNLASEADTVKSEVSCLSYYDRMRIAANEDSENRKPSHAEYVRSVPIYSAPLRSKNKSSGDGLASKGRKLTDPLPPLDEAKPKRQPTHDLEEVKVKRQPSRDLEEVKLKRQPSRDQEEVKVKRQSSQDYDDIKVKRQASRDLSENLFTRQISKEQVPPQLEPEQAMEVESTVAPNIPEPEETPVTEPEPEEESKAARKKRREEKRKLKEQQQQSQEEVPIESQASLEETPVEIQPQAVEEPPKEETPVEPSPVEPIEEQPVEVISEPAPAEPELISDSQPELLPEPTPELLPEPTPGLLPEPQPETQPEAQPEPEPIAEAEVAQETIPEPTNIPEEAQATDVPSSEPTAEPEPEPALETSASIESAPEPEVTTQSEIIPESPQPLVEEPQSPEIEIPLEGKNIEEVVLSTQQSSEPVQPVDDFWGNADN